MTTERAFIYFVAVPLFIILVWIMVNEIWKDSSATGCFGLAVIFLLLGTITALARDDGRYANSPLKPWFDSLKSKKGPCCSDADGFALSDVEWQSKNGHYQVLLEGQWHDVPEDALITVPNLFGRTMVWPIRGSLGLTIRCFMPGPGT